MYSNVLILILGGGKGTRLNPLTKERAKPAVPLGGKYRLIDIALSNSLNSGFRGIYVLTQFNSASLNSHIFRGYRLDHYSGGFVEVLAAQQTHHAEEWFLGTADAVRKHMSQYISHDPDYFIILSGDQLYSMDLRHLLEKHIHANADISVAATPVEREQASELGILKVDKGQSVVDFHEKPGSEANIDEWRFNGEVRKNIPDIALEKEYLASMGIYVFNRTALEKCLDNKVTDFGKEIIPNAIKNSEYRVNSYIYTNYWEDIGTIRHFFKANLDLTSITPHFNLYDSRMPILPNVASLPPSKINACTFSESMACEGSIITCANVTNSLIGPRSVIETESTLDHVYLMGASRFETEDDKAINRRVGRPDIGIGSHTVIKNAIIDKNIRIGDNCSIGMQEYGEDEHNDDYSIVDGIVVIPKNTVIPDGTVI